MLSDAGRTGKAMGERKISRDATARSSPRGDPVGQRGMTWHSPSTGFPSGTASLKSPRWSRAIPKEDTASQGMLQAGRCHLPDHSRICTEDDLGPPASALSRWHPNVTDPRGAAPWWPHGKTSTNFCPSWGGDEVSHGSGYNPVLVSGHGEDANARLPYCKSKLPRRAQGYRTLSIHHFPHHLQRCPILPASSRSPSPPPWRCVAQTLEPQKY